MASGYDNEKGSLFLLICGAWVGMMFWSLAHAWLLYRMFRERTWQHFLTTFLVLLSLLCVFSLSWNASHVIMRIPAFMLWAVLPVFGATVTLAAWYFRFTDTLFDHDVVLVGCQTTGTETLEFIFPYLNLKTVSQILFSLIAALGILALSAGIFHATGRLSTEIARLAAMAGFATVAAFSFHRNGMVVCCRKGIRDYREGVDYLRRTRETYLAADPPKVLKRERGELTVLIIGESTCRTYMHNYGGAVANTPWMDSMESNPGWVRLENAYSFCSHTIISVLGMVREYRVATGLGAFDDTAHHDILGVARACGMSTAWLSNHPSIGLYESGLAALGSTTDHALFVQDGAGVEGRKVHHDGALIAPTRRYLDSLDWERNNLLVLHVIGNHAPYRKRFPPGFPQVKVRGREWLGGADISPIKIRQYGEYMTSIAFLDHVLGEIHAKLLANDARPISMVFVPDHGEEVMHPRYWGHHLMSFTWDKLRIPALVWLSTGYRNRYPEKLPNLKNNASRIFTNDLTFDLLMGLLHVESDLYRPDYDVSSPEYGVTLDNARLLSNIMVNGDSGIAMKRNLRDSRIMQKAVALHCEPVFKALQAKNRGLKRIAVTLRRAAGAAGERRVMVGTAGELDLSTYLSEVAPEIELFWFDLLDAQGEAAADFLDLLNQADEQFSLRERSLVVTEAGEAVKNFVDAGWRTGYSITSDLTNLDSEKEAATIAGCGSAGVVFPLGIAPPILDSLFPLLPDGVELYARAGDETNLSDPNLALVLERQDLRRISLIGLEMDSCYGEYAVPVPNPFSKK